MGNVISNLSFTEIADTVASCYLLLRGSSPSGVSTPSNANGFGVGVDSTWGAFSITDDVVAALADAALVGATGIDPIAALATDVQGLANKLAISAIASNVFGSLLASLNGQVATAGLSGVTSLNTFLTLRNTGEVTKWQILVPRAFKEVWEYCQPGQTLSPCNAWFEVLQGTLYTYALGKKVVAGAFTAGASVDTSLYCGGFPYVKVDSFAGSSDTVTVTGTQFDPATKTVTAGKTWTATVAANSTVALTPGGSAPAATDSLIVAVSAIAVGSNISGGNVYVECHRPSGRDEFAYL